MAGPKVLAQHAGTGSLTSVYTSPSAGGGTVVSSIVFAGVTGTGIAEVRVAVGAAADAAVQVLVPVFAVRASEHLALTEGITLAAGDVVRVNASGGVNVHLYGSEL